MDAATVWVEVRGKPLQATANTGWIAPRYLASRPDGGEPASGSLAWDPPKGLAGVATIIC
jgi:hypothetical protein